MMLAVVAEREDGALLAIAPGAAEALENPPAILVVDGRTWPTSVQSALARGTWRPANEGIDIHVEPELPQDRDQASDPLGQLRKAARRKHHPGEHDQDSHGHRGVADIAASALDGIEIYSPERVKEIYGDVWDDAGVRLGDDGVHLMARYFENGDMLVSWDLPDGSSQVLEEMDVESMRQLADDIERVLDEFDYADFDPDDYGPTDAVAEADSDKHGFYMYADRDGDIRIDPEGGGNSESAFDISAAHAREFVNALNDMANGHEDHFEYGDPDEKSAGKSSLKGAPMATKSFTPTVKAVGQSGDQGTATFRIASYNEVDKDGDVTVPGFFGKQPVQMVPVHDWNHVPIGKGRIYEKPDGVYCDVKFNLNIPAARDWYEHIKFDMENGPALQEYCADEETEILTTRGWLRFDELTTADQAYALDTATGTAKFEDVVEVNIWPRKERELRLIETGGFSSMTTAFHRWPVRFNDGTSGWRTTEKLATSNGILRAAPRVDAPTDVKWSDAFVELVAWFWNEGWRERGRYALIGQSTKVNAQKVAAIRGALSVAFPGQWTEATDTKGMTRFRLKRDASLALFEVVGANKAPHVEFLLALTTAQLRLLIERCLDGDGTRHASGTRLWYQSDADAIGTFEMACALAGEPTASHCDKPKEDGLRPRRTVSLLRSPVAVPLAAIRVKRYNSKPRRTVAVDEWVTYEGHVWCPTTPSGTWLARRRGSVYFTGNSYGYEVLPGGSKAGQHQGKQVRFLVPRDDGTPGVKVFEVSPVLQGAGTGTRTVSVKGRSMRINRAGESGGTASRAVKGAIPCHETKTVSRAWDRVRTEAALPDDARPSELRTVYAYVDPEGDPELKASYGWPHHHGIGGPANLRACLMGIAALNGPAGADMGEPERKGIYDHLAGHLKDADRDVPDLRTGPGDSKNRRFSDEAATVLAAVGGLTDRASEVMAMRRTKGKGMAANTADLLGWVSDELVRLKGLLSNPVEPEIAQPDDDEVASVFAASIARLNGI